MSKHRGIIILVVAIIAAVLLVFRIWAAPAMMTVENSNSFFGVFKEQFGRVKQEAKVVLPQVLTKPEYRDTLSPETVEKIDEAIDQKLAEPAPTLPEAENRKTKRVK